MENSSDLELILQIQKSNEEAALLEIIRRHSNLFYDRVNFFFRKSNKQQLRREVLQEKDNVIYKCCLKFDPSRKAKFSTLLANETRWTCLNFLTVFEKRMEVEEVDSLDHPDQIIDPAAPNIKADLIKKAYEEINNIEDERARKIFNLRYSQSNDRKLTTWKEIRGQVGLTSQGCLDIHKRYIKMISERIKAYANSDQRAD